MIRKLTLLLLLCTGLNHVAKAVVIRDSVSIYLPPHTDTTCPGDQLTFVAVQSDTSFIRLGGVSYHWFINGVFTGVYVSDTFLTTAPVDGDNVWCELHFTNSAGFADSSLSNVITVHRSSAIPPGVIISLISGSNPDCAGHPLTFSAYPINGGLAPAYQWEINGAPVPGATSRTYTNIFGGSDTVSCRMISNSPCRTFDTAYSNTVPIIHVHLTAAVTITVTRNPICAGDTTTFNATLVNPGSGYTLGWYVNGRHVVGAIGTTYVTDSLPNGALVYCLLHTVDSCISNDTANSNPIIMTVIPNAVTAVSALMTHGANPGCLDSAVTLKGSYINFGTTPNFTWYINGVAVRADTVLDTTFSNGDIVTFKVNSTDGGCYTRDTVSSIAFLMLRDSTPATPLVSLIGNLLVANHSGTYRWYGPSGGAGGPIELVPGATGQTFHPPFTGYYYAIRDTGNCPSDTSNIIYVALLEVKNVLLTQAHIYPNPTTGVLNLDWGGDHATMQADIFSILGQGLIHKDIINESHFEIDMSYLPPGNYILVLRAEDGSKESYKISLTR
jgi:hypothetical protein